MAAKDKIEPKKSFTMRPRLTTSEKIEPGESVQISFGLFFDNEGIFSDREAIENR